MKYRIIPVLVIVLSFMFLRESFVFAQDASVMTREERAQRHEERIREILQKRREERMERAKEEEAQKEAAAPAGAKEAQGPARPLSSVFLGYKFLNEEGVLAYNSIVRENSEFLSEVILFNVDQNPVDRIRLALDYDKRFMEPTRVFDSSIRPFVEGKPEFRHDRRNGLLLYDAAMKQPLEMPETAVLKIMWKAARPTPFTGIEFEFAPTDTEERPHTAIYSRGKNILGFEDDPMDGVISGGVMIDPVSGRDKMLQGKAEELREIYLGSIGATTEVGLELVPPDEVPEVGEPFMVGVRLNNPEGALLDHLSFFVRFDPKTLQVLDTHKFNWITRGVNILDGPYHENYDWDIHMKNEVRNDRGLIHYSMANSQGRSFPSGYLAQIHFLPIASTPSTPIGFVKGRAGAPDLTSVRYFGYEILNLGSEYSKPALDIPIVNPPPEVAAARKERMNSDGVSSEAATAEELGPRSLKIIRD